MESTPIEASMTVHQLIFGLLGYSASHAMAHKDSTSKFTYILDKLF